MIALLGPKGLKGSSALLLACLVAFALMLSFRSSGRSGWSGASTAPQYMGFDKPPHIVAEGATLVDEKQPKKHKEIPRPFLLAAAHSQIDGYLSSASSAVAEAPAAAAAAAAAAASTSSSSYTTTTTTDSSSPQIPPEPPSLPSSTLATAEETSTEETVIDHQQDKAAETPTLKIIQDLSQSESNIGPPANPFNLTTGLVVGRLNAEASKVQWIHDELKDITHKAIYIVDDPGAPLHLDENRGREAIVYIKYILEHYDALDDVTLFFHDSRLAWHNNVLMNQDAAVMINNLRRDHVVERGYFPARCELYPGCAADGTWADFNKGLAEASVHPERPSWLFNTALWDELFPARVGGDPVSLAEPCCSQFAASRAQIRAVPRETWQRIYTWLFSTTLSDSFTGRIMEYVWQYLFLQRDAYCPSMTECYCKGYGLCLTDDADLVQYNALREETDRLLPQMSEYEHTHACHSKPTPDEVLTCRQSSPVFDLLVTNYAAKSKFEKELPVRIGITSP